MATKTTKRKTDAAKNAAAQAASKAAQIFGTPGSLFTGRAKVSSLGLQRGISEMVRRVYACVPGVAPMSPTHPQIKTTYIGEQACARYTWARDSKGKLSVAGIINLPACGESDAVIPRAIADQYTGYALHEMSHFLFTPLQSFSRYIQTLARAHNVSEDYAKGIVNGLEDVVIERNLIESGYAPGAGAMLRGLLEKCIAEVPRAKYGTLHAFPVTLCFGLRGYTPAAQPLVDALPPVLRAIYDDAARALAALPLRSIGDVDAMEGVAGVADGVLRALAALREQQPKREPGDMPGEPGDDGEPTDAEGEPTDAEGEPTDAEGEPGEGDDGDGEPGDDGDGDPMGEPGDGAGSTPAPALPDVPEQPDDVTPDATPGDAGEQDADDGDAPDDKPKTETKADEHTPAKDTGEDANPDAPQLDTDALKGKPIDGDMQPEAAGDAGAGASGLDNDNVRIRVAAEGATVYGDDVKQSVAEALTKSARIAHSLRTLLDTSARDSREGGRKNGRLDMGALSRIAVGAESVFEKRAYKDGSDAAVSILVDCSSSMNAGGRFRAARTLAGVLSKIISGCAGVRCEILGFHSGGGSGGMAGSLTSAIVQDMGTAEDQLLMSSLRGDCCVTIFKGFHESHARAMSRLGSCYGAGGTPDAASIICAAERLKKEDAEQRILIVIADGEGSPDSVLSRIVRRYTREGITMIAVGIEQEMNEAFAHRALVTDVRKLNESGLGALLHALAQGETARAIASGND